MRVDWLLTGGLSCWLGTPLLSDGANGFIVKKCSPGLNLTSRSCPTPHHGLPSPSPPSTKAVALAAGGGLTVFVEEVSAAASHDLNASK